MSLNKAIQHGKEHRKKYTGGKAVDKSCRNHGTCPFCQGNRLHRANLEKEKMEIREKDFENSLDMEEEE